MPDKEKDADEKLRQEFNRWVLNGRAAGMESRHLSIAEQTIRRMALKPGERVLDLGCGTGWATRMVARLVAEGPVGFGQVIGLDISDEMIARAREESRESDNILFVWSPADRIPWEENYFDKVLSIEAFYYYPDQERVLAEMFRVMAPKAQLYILINLYKENSSSLRWVDKLGVPVQLRSENEYAEMLERHSFEEVEIHHVPDESLPRNDYQGAGFDSAQQLRDYQRVGALLLTARKPDVLTPSSEIESY
jgi:ubiquinone/menaquinone biosynthesis C-methylase UbiE